MTLEEVYSALLTKDTDMRDHLPVLREYASMCDHVTEFGVRHGVSTTALLAANPVTLDLYDVHQSAAADRLMALRGHVRTQVTFHQEDTRTATISQTDLLLIDTVHTAEQVYAELTRHAPKVSTFLAFHDTTTCGERDVGQPGHPLGLRWGIGRYMHEQEGVWEQVYETTACHGLTIYQRVR